MYHTYMETMVCALYTIDSPPSIPAILGTGLISEGATFLGEKMNTKALLEYRVASFQGSPDYCLYSKATELMVN